MSGWQPIRVADVLGWQMSGGKSPGGKCLGDKCPRSGTNQYAHLIRVESCGRAKPLRGECISGWAFLAASKIRPISI
jgi:hypothetical protein